MRNSSRRGTRALAIALACLAILVLAPVPGGGPVPPPPVPRGAGAPAVAPAAAAAPLPMRALPLPIAAAPPVAPVAGGPAAAPPPPARAARTPVGPGRRVFPLVPAPEAADPVERAHLVLRRFAADLGLDRAPGELRLVRSFESPVGRHVRFRQVVDGLEVEHSEVSVHVAPDGRVLAVNADLWPVALPLPAATVTEADARETAIEEAAPGDEESPSASDPILVLHPSGKGARPAWRVDVESEETALRVWVDAASGEVAGTRELRVSATGTARVFRPNPLLSARDASFTDGGDAETPALTAQISEVALDGLDGTGFLRGEWVDVTPSAGAVQRLDGDFRFLRSEAGFEQASAYFHLDAIQRHIRGTLGFDDVNARMQPVRARGTSQDNSFYDLKSGVITYGTGGVDDAEDADIVIHEYGHAIQDDQVPGFGVAREAGSVGEGFADFLACSRHATGDDLWDASFGSWDAVSFPVPGSPPALRRMDREKVYPSDVVGKVHADGEIWSGALWELRAALGAEAVERLVIGSHFLLTPSSGFRSCGSALLVANESLRGGADAQLIEGVLRDRGLVLADDGFEDNDTAAAAAAVPRATMTGLHLADDDWFRFEVEAGTSVTATARFSHPSPNLTLRLHAADLTLLATSAGAGDTESVVTGTVSGRTEFLLRVSRASPWPGAYDLEFTGGLVLPGPDAYEPNDSEGAARFLPARFVPGLSLEGDEDWYSVPAVAGTRVTVIAYFDADAIDLDLELRAPSGAVLASSDGLGHTEEVEWEVPSAGPGTLLLRVHAPAGGGSYALLTAVEPLVLMAGRDVLKSQVGATAELVVGLAIPEDEVPVREVRVQALRRGRRGAVPEVEILAPSGETLVPLGTGARKRGAVVKFTGLTGSTYRILVRPVAPTEGNFRIRTRVR